MLGQQPEATSVAWHWTHKMLLAGDAANHWRLSPTLAAIKLHVKGWQPFAKLIAATNGFGLRLVRGHHLSEDCQPQSLGRKTLEHFELKSAKSPDLIWNWLQIHHRHLSTRLRRAANKGTPQIKSKHSRL